VAVSLLLVVFLCITKAEGFPAVNVSH